MFDFWKLLQLLAKAIAFLDKLSPSSPEGLELHDQLRNTHSAVKKQLDDTPAKIG
jgi:hypothetical protein